MKPKDLKTRIFLDGGDPEETRTLLGLMGFLDGQTTNPTLIAANPEVRKRLDRGERFSEAEVHDFSRAIVRTLSGLIPAGSISIEVSADKTTRAETMLAQATELATWIPNSHIKFPVTREGLKAAEQVVRKGMRVNMTLCFSQEQAAAVYAATRGAEPGQVIVSPFVGRLDDQGENGMHLVGNILRMYRAGDGHVQVLTASVRSIDHLLYAIKLGSAIVTAPFGILKTWAQRGMTVPGAEYRYDPGSRRPIPYRAVGLARPWQEYDIRHPLTDKGLEKFSADWNGLVAREQKKTA